MLFLAYLGNYTVIAQGPSYIFRHVTEADGLASNNITGIQQDEKGFIWFATPNGLQKYDGYNFTTYHHDPADPRSISSDITTWLLKDRENNMWVLTAFFGCNKFDPVTCKNTRVQDFNDSSLKNLDDAVDACLDDKGNVWFTGIYTIGKYDTRQHRMISYEKTLPGDPDIGLTATILSDPRTGNIWVNSYKYGVCMLDPQKNVFYYRLNNPFKLPVLSINEHVGKMFLDRQNTLWINTYKGDLYRYNLISRQLRRCYPGKNVTILTTCFLQDKRGVVWIGTGNNGLLKYIPGNDSFQFVERTADGLGGLDYEAGINCLFEDKEGNIWIGTDKGINIFNPYREKFLCISNPVIAGSSAQKFPLLSFLESKDGNIWAATNGAGVELFDKDLAFSKRYLYDAQSPYALKEPGNRIWSFTGQPDGKIWVGSQHGWLSVFDPLTGKFSSSQPKELDQRTILKMTADKLNNIWFALFSGIAKWDPLAGAFTHYNNIIRYRDKTISQINDILIDDRNTCWVATLTNGLQRFDPESGKFTRMYVPDTGSDHGISSSTVLSLAGINDSLLAIGTIAGINLFNKRTEHFDYINARDGLPDNSVFALHFVPPYDLWAVTDHGISKVNIYNRHVTSYGLEDGIASNSFSDCQQLYKMRDGRLLAGYRGGFVCFNPDSVIAKEPPADVTITGCKVYDQALKLDSIFHTPDSTISLSYQQNFITIGFASLSYLEPNRINYYYQLQGLEKDWVKAGHQRYATYAYLPGGRYVFNVKCENRDGIPCGRITALVFFINPPFWQTWWFRTLAVLAVIFLFYAFYRYRIAQLLKMQAVRNAISRDLHDDIGATLSTIRILSEVAKSDIEKGQQEQSYSLLTKISNHSREMVVKMSDIVWTIHPKNENMEGIQLRLKDFALETCIAKGIELRFAMDEPLRKKSLPMMIRKNIYLICKEAINNAIKHSGCTRVGVQFNKFPGGIEITVTDNGKGFDPQFSRSSNGLNNMESRALEMKGRLEIHSGKNNTRIRLQIRIA